MAKRRGLGEGSISQRPDGLWMGQVNLGIIDGKRRRRTVYGKTRREVADKLREVQREIERGQTTPGKETLAQFLERWLADVASQRVKAKTLNSYQQLIRSHIIPALGRIKLAKLTAQDVQRLLTALATDHSARTVAYVRQVLASALDTAERWDLVSRNVARLTDAPKGAKRKGTALTVDQALHLLATADGDRYELAYVLAIYAGLRRGEICGLQWGDIDRQDGTLTVRRAVVHIDGAMAVSDLKTSASHRTIPLTDIALAAIERRAELEVLERGDIDPSRYLFATRSGKPLHPRNLYRAFQELLVRAGLPQMRFHDLRHTAASLMARAGVPMHVAQRILGHSSIRITADTYTHLIGNEQRQAAEALNTLVGSPILEKRQ